MADCLLLRPGVTALFERYLFCKREGLMRWHADVSYVGHHASKNGFAGPSEAFRWAEEQMARFEAFVVA